MQGAMDIEAKTPLLEKNPYLDADKGVPSFETAFPIRKRLKRRVVASILTVFQPRGRGRGRTRMDDASLKP
jgi:hypothetical protein